MAGVDGARQRHNNQTKRQENGDGWRRDKEDREGKGKRGATTDIIIFFFKNNCAVAD
jgi:hypothetical protein